MTIESQSWEELKTDMEFHRSYVDGPRASALVGEYQAWYPDAGAPEDADRNLTYLGSI